MRNLKLMTIKTLKAALKMAELNSHGQLTAEAQVMMNERIELIKAELVRRSGK